MTLLTTLLARANVVVLGPLHSGVECIEYDALCLRDETEAGYTTYVWQEVW